MHDFTLLYGPSRVIRASDSFLEKSVTFTSRPPGMTRMKEKPANRRPETGVNFPRPHCKRLYGFYVYK